MRGHEGLNSARAARPWNAARSRSSRPRRRTPAATPARTCRRDRSRGTDGRWSGPPPPAADGLGPSPSPVRRRRNCPCPGTRRPSAMPTPEATAWCVYACSPLWKSARWPSDPECVPAGEDQGSRYGEPGPRRALGKAGLSSRTLRTLDRRFAPGNARTLARGGTSRGGRPVTPCRTARGRSRSPDPSRRRAPPRAPVHCGNTIRARTSDRPDARLLGSFSIRPAPARCVSTGHLSRTVGYVSLYPEPADEHCYLTFHQLICENVCCEQEFAVTRGQRVGPRYECTGVARCEYPGCSPRDPGRCPGVWGLSPPS
jgi:hypothetical protein